MAREDLERTLDAFTLPDVPSGRGPTLDPRAYAQFVETMK
jgi:hypothetical protein